MKKPNQTNDDIANASSDAVQKLAHAAQTAVQTISDAASEATKVVATAAATAAAMAEATKLKAIATDKDSNDHDLLVRLETQLLGLKEDIGKLRIEQIGRVNDHEARINDLERSNIRQTVCVAVGVIWLTALTGMTIYHLFKIPV
jgi:cell division septum initiation protein DivIVA